VIQFVMHDRRIKFVLPLPSKSSSEFTQSKRGARDDHMAYKLWERATRQRWRALALVVKAKLESVEANIATFENEFLANIVMPNGKTVSEMALPSIENAYKGVKVSQLLLT